MGKLKDNLNVQRFRQTAKPVRLQSVMTARKRNAAHERTMGFLDNEGHWVNAVVLVGLDGLPVDLASITLKLDVIAEALLEINEKTGS